MPPLEGEVVERQRNRRGLFVNRAVQETPQSAYGCQLPFQGRPWQNQNPPPFTQLLNPASGRVRSSGCFLKSGVTGGFYPPLLDVLFILLYVLKSNLSY